MSYKPLPDNLLIKESSIHGLGLFAKEDIIKRDYENSAIANTHFKFFINTKGIVFHHSTLLRLEAGGYINHSSKPNVTLKKTLIPYDTDEFKNWEYYGIFPLRDIIKGEEIFLDYAVEFCSEDYKDEEWMKVSDALREANRI